jgi:hypothetical protein
VEDTIVRSEPLKEIVIIEQNRFPTPEDLARFTNIAAGGKTAGVYWANGVAFIYYPLPTTTETVSKVFIEQKRAYWAFVSHTIMPEYRPLIETKEKIIVPVIDMSTSLMFQKVAEWLKKQS